MGCPHPCSVCFLLLTRERERNKQREGERAHPDSRGRGARSSHGGLDARAGGSRPDSGPLPRAAADPAGRAERGGGVATSGGGPRQGRRAAGTGARRGRAVEADRGSARRGSRRRCPMGRPVSRRRRRRRGEEAKSGGVAVESAGDGGKYPAEAPLLPPWQQGGCGYRAEAATATTAARGGAPATGSMTR